LNIFPKVAIRKYGVATPLLPNVFGALLLGDLKGYVNARGSIFLHPGQNMAGEVEHNPKAGMPDSVLERRMPLGLDPRVSNDSRCKKTRQNIELEPRF
jgi:hypothetical protein